jgi:hypothetical protein
MTPNLQGRNASGACARALVSIAGFAWQLRHCIFQSDLFDPPWPHGVLLRRFSHSQPLGADCGTCIVNGASHRLLFYL